MTFDDDRPGTEGVPPGERDRERAAHPGDLTDPLGGLAPEVEPPAGLRREVVARLHEEGLLAAPRSFAARARWPLTAAAVLVAFMGGRASAGSAGSSPPRGSGAPGRTVEAVSAETDRGFHAPRDAWALLLYEDGRFDPGGLTTDELVEAYGAWASVARDAGVLVLAEKLGDVEVELREGEVARRSLAGVSSPGAAPGVLTGLFVVQAPDEGAALGVARETPHYRMGGTVVVRPIDPT